MTRSSEHRRLLVVVAAVIALLLGLGYYLENKDGGKIRYDVVGRNVGLENLEAAEVRFVDVDFYFEWGVLVPNATKSFAGLNVRNVPKQALIAWLYKEKREIHAVEIPAIPQDVAAHGSLVTIDGRMQQASLVLRFNIDPHARTVDAVWSNSQFPRRGEP